MLFPAVDVVLNGWIDSKIRSVGFWSSLTAVNLDVVTPVYIAWVLSADELGGRGCSTGSSPSSTGCNRLAILQHCDMCISWWN